MDYQEKHSQMLRIGADQEKEMVKEPGITVIWTRRKI